MAAVAVLRVMRGIDMKPSRLVGTVNRATKSQERMVPNSYPHVEQGTRSLCYLVLLYKEISRVLPCS